MELLNIMVILASVLYQNVALERQHVRVGDIEYKCGEDGNIVKMKSNTTKLRLPVNCQAMYSVNTERTTDCTNQRCTLMTWKIIRNLEMFLNTHHNNTGSTGLVEFRNEMMIPDFNYLLHVILKNSEGKLEETDFNITFSEERDAEPKQILGRLDLNIGSSIAYSSLPVIINANVTLCGNISYYFFRWSLITSSQGTSLPEKSSQLTILTQMLKTLDKKSFVINCLVIHFETNVTLLEGSTTIRIKDPPTHRNEIDVKLPFKYVTIKKGAAISIIPYIHHTMMPDAEYKIKWSCMLGQTWLNECQGQINKEFYMETGFEEEGNYSITLKVSRGEFENSVSCSIIVCKNVPSIQLEADYPIRPERGIRVTSKISELRTYCVVHWESEEVHFLELNHIPGFHKEIYNISARDKTFLREIEEFGNMTVTREFKLTIPSPSMNWNGLSPNTYNLKMVVSCPTPSEINDMNVLKEVPDQFMTISAQAEFVVPQSPRVKSLKVSSENNIALISYYVYKVDRDDDAIDAMVYKYGFILNNLEVIFYSGIDAFNARTVMPYNGENGVETFIEVCDYQNRCGKTFGPVITTRTTHDLDDNLVIKTFKQQLIEEDFYNAFLYVFVVLHSMRYTDQTKKYSTILSSEISSNMKSIMEEDYEDTKAVANKFLKNLVIFIPHLVLSKDVMEQLSLMTRQFSTNAMSRLGVLRYASRTLLSTSEVSSVTLEEIKNFLIASEYVVLGSLTNESNNKEKDHMLNLLDGWMVLACNMIFHGQRVTNIEMQTMTFSVNKMSKQLVNKVITLSNLNWTKTAKLKIKEMSEYSGSKLCLGESMLKNFFSQTGLTFGANIYSADEQLMEINVSAQIEVFIPIDPGISTTIQPKCVVYKNGLTASCLIVKRSTNFIECSCPSFGYFFLEYTDILPKMDGSNVAIFHNISYDNFNRTDDYHNGVNGNVKLGQKISYVIIASSLVGFVILCYIIRKLMIMPPPNRGMDGLQENVLYGHVMHEEALD